MGHNGIETKELTRAQHRLIAALLVSRTTRAACQAANVSTSTAYRWLSEPRFVAALASAEGTQIADATRRLIGLADNAIDELSNVFADALAPRTVKIRAAGMVLDHMLALRELRNVESRLAALEAAAYANDTEGARAL